MPLAPRHPDVPRSVHAHDCVVVTELGSPEPAEAGPSTADSRVMTG